MALVVWGVFLPELSALLRPELVNDESRALSLETVAKTGRWGGDIGRISGWFASSEPTSGSAVETTPVPLDVKRDGVVALRTDVENGLKAGVVRRCSCLSCCSCIIRSAGKRGAVPDGGGVDSRSRKLTNSSENDLTTHTYTDRYIVNWTEHLSISNYLHKHDYQFEKIILTYVDGPTPQSLRKESHTERYTRNKTQIIPNN